MTRTLLPLALLLIAACERPPQTPGAPPGAGPGTPSNAIAPGATALPLPETAPFDALTRTTPITLVDQRGAQVLVIDGLGTRVSVTRLLSDRALVTCTGCRAPVEGWLQRGALLPAAGVDISAENVTDDDRMLLQLLAAAAPEQAEALGAGLVPSGDGWIAPPWHGEGGYAGAVVAVTPDGEGWTLAAPIADAPPTDPTAEP